MALTFSAGATATAGQENSTLTLSVIKANNQTATTTTLANDTDLALDLAAGRTYEVQLRLVAAGPAAGDIKTAWLRSGTINHVGVRTCAGPSQTTTDASGNGTTGTFPGIVRRTGGHALTTTVPYGLDGTNSSYIEEAFVVQVDVAGTLTLQWAQQAASGTTTVSSGSYLIARPIG